MTLFRPREAFDGFEDPRFGWGGLLPCMEVEVLPVYPRGMLVEPFARTLADRVKDCLDRATFSES